MSSRMSMNGVKIAKGRRGKKRRRLRQEVNEPVESTRWSAHKLDGLALALVKSGACSRHILDESHARRLMRNGWL